MCTLGSSFAKTLTLPLNRTVTEIVVSDDRYWVPPLFSTHLQMLAREAADKGLCPSNPRNTIPEFSNVEFLCH